MYKEFRIKDCIMDVLLRGQDRALIVIEVNTYKPDSAAWHGRSESIATLSGKSLLTFSERKCQHEATSSCLTNGNKRER